MSLPETKIIKIQKEAEIVQQDYYKSIDEGREFIDVEAYLESVLGVDIIPVVNLEAEHGINGIIATDFKSIYVDQQLMTDERRNSRYRFTLAHELGHINLHQKYFREDLLVENWSNGNSVLDVHKLSDREYSFLEIEANEFAGTLLVPEDALIYEIRRLLRKNIDLVLDGGQIELSKLIAGMSGGLAKFFKVSDKVIEIRLERYEIEKKLSNALGPIINNENKVSMFSLLDQMVIS